MFITSMQY